jgi:sugar/nucleoside kinase (ribokinase family)
LDFIKEAGKRIIDCGVKILLIKAGARGAYLLTGDVSSINRLPGFNLPGEIWNFKELWCNAYHADESRILNSSGAGDTAVAAFLTSILNGESPEDSLKYSAIAGRNNLYCHDLYDDLSDWQKMTEEIRSDPHDILNIKTKS